MRFERVKASEFDDRKWVHIINMNPFSIIKSRELSRNSKCKISTLHSIKWAVFTFSVIFAPSVLSVISVVKKITTEITDNTERSKNDRKFSLHKVNKARFSIRERFLSAYKSLTHELIGENDANAPRVKQSKTTQYYNVGSFSIDLTSGLWRRFPLSIHV